MARFNANGSFDNSFDADGKVILAPGSGNDAAQAIVVQSDGKILIGGYSDSGTNRVFVMVRFNSDGSLDSSFDGDGIVQTTIDTTAIIYGLALQTDGRIVATGYSLSSGVPQYTVARFNTNGSLDLTLDGDGIVQVLPGSSSSFSQSVAIQRDGKIVVGGTTWNNGYDFALIRLNPNGKLDSTFDSDGKAVAGIGTGYDFAYGMAIQTNGRIVLAGYADNAGQNDFALACFMGDGPAASSISNVSVNEDATDSTIDLFTAFSDPTDADDALTYTVVGNTNPVLFTYSINPTTGLLILDYVANQNGSANVTIRATEPVGWYDETTFTLTVQSVNDAPSGTDATVSTSEDTSYVFAVADFGLNDPFDVPANEFNAVKIVNLPSAGALLLNGTPIAANDSISKDDLNSGKLRYVPPANGFGNALGTFTFQVQDDGGILAGGIDTDPTPNQITMNVLAVGDTPQVASPTTLEDTLSAAIVISRYGADGAEVTHFKISGITGGTLFKNDGVTPLNDGDFVTFAEGQAGVKFLPALNSLVVGHFDVESSQNGTTVATQRGKATSAITVLPDSAPPTISVSPGNQTLLEEGTTGALTFTICDNVTAVGALVVSASSSNTTLIPNGNLVLGGSGGNRTLTVTTAAHQNGGPATITVTVADAAGNSSQICFTVTVTAVNDVPSFTKGTNQTVAINAGPQSVTSWATGISAGPSDEAGQTLTFQVTNDNAGLFAFARRSPRMGR